MYASYTYSSKCVNYFIVLFSEEESKCDPSQSKAHGKSTPDYAEKD